MPTDDRQVTLTSGIFNRDVIVAHERRPCVEHDFASKTHGMNPLSMVARLFLVTVLTASMFCGATLSFGQQPLKTTESRPGVSTAAHSKHPNTDGLGDPLPPSALLRLGTVRFHPPSGINELALSPDNKTLVSVGKQLIVWDPQTGQERWHASDEHFQVESHGSRYGSRPIAFSSDSSQFFTAHAANAIAIWDVASKKSDILTIQTRKVESANVLSLDVTPDGKTFALGRPNSVLIFQRDGKVLHEMANSVEAPLMNINRDRLGFFGHYSYARFSPDGAILAVVTSDRPEELRIHDVITGQELRKIALTSKLVRLTFLPDNQHLAATERDSAVRVYNLKTGQPIWSHVVPLNNPFENYLSAVAVSPDGRHIVAGATDHAIYLLDSSTGAEIGRLIGHHWYPWTMTFTADSKQLYSAGWDGMIRRWDVAKRQQLSLAGGVQATEVVTASPDGRTLAYQDDFRTIRLVKSDTGEELRQIEVAGMHFSQLQFSPDGTLLAGGGSRADQVQVVLWDVRTGDQVQNWNWPKGRDPHSKVEALSFTPDGSKLAAAVFRQSMAYIWELAGGQPVATLKHGEIYGLSFSPDSKTLATAGWDSKVRFWDADTGELRREFAVSTEKNDQAPMPAPVRVPARGKVNLNQRVGDLRMYAVSYAPQGGLIATAHMTSEVWIWQADTMQPRMKFQVDGSFVYGALSFSPDGLWLATGASNGSIDVWDPLTGQKVWGRGKHGHYAYTVGFGRNNQSLVSGGEDGLCYLWDLRPQDQHPQEADLTKLWDDLKGEASLPAYQALWGMSNSKDRAVTFIGDKLKLTKTLIDPDRLAEGISDEENQRRKQMKRLLAEKDPKVGLAIAARRAISLLEQIDTPAARRQLEELVKRDPESELGKLAADALRRNRIAQP